MLSINQLNGFGVNTPDAIVLRHVAYNTYTTTGTSAAQVSSTATVAGRRGLILSAADNAGTNGASCYGGSQYSSNSPAASDELFSTTNDPGAANAGVTLAVATDLDEVGDQTVVSYWNSGATAAAKTIILLEAYTANGGQVEVVDHSSSTGTGTNPGITTNALKAGDLVVAFVAQEARTAPSTPSPSFTTQQSAIADTATAGTSIALSYQTYTAATDLSGVTYGVLLSASRDYVVGYVVFRAVD